MNGMGNSASLLSIMLSIYLISAQVMMKLILLERDMLLNYPKGQHVNAHYVNRLVSDDVC